MAKVLRPPFSLKATEVHPKRYADGSDEHGPRHFLTTCFDPDCELCPPHWRERNRVEQEKKYDAKGTNAGKRFNT